MPYVLRDAQGREYPVGVMVHIGRDPTNQVVLSDPLASRVHATVWDQQGALYLRDENSGNGSFVNGARVQQASLRAGDQIQIGNTLLIVSGPPEAKPGPAAPPVQPVKRKGGRGRRLLVGCLVLVLACAAVSMGGYVAYRAGMITPTTVLNLVGLGPGAIELDNFRDDAIHVSILQLDVAEDSFPLQTTLEIEAFGIRNYRVSEPGRYRVDFGTTSGSADLGTCTLNVRSADQYQFVALPDMVVVNRVKDPVAVGTDLIVATSALCR